MPPYSASFKYVPEIGHQVEVRQALEEAAWRYQTGSLRISVISELAGQAQSALTGFIQFETLAEYHEFLKDPNDHQAKASEDLRTKLSGIVRETSSSILDIVMPLGSPLGRDGYAQIVSREPSPGKADEVRDRSLELGRVLRSKGLNVAVSVQLAGPQSGECSLTTGFALLEDWESFRSKTETDSEVQEAMEPLAPILAKPASVTLYSIVIPAPPRDHTYSDA